MAKETYTVKNHNTLCINGKPFMTVKPAGEARQADVDTMLQLMAVLLNLDLEKR